MAAVALAASATVEVMVPERRDRDEAAVDALGSTPPPHQPLARPPAGAAAGRRCPTATGMGSNVRGAPHTPAAESRRGEARRESTLVSASTLADPCPLVCSPAAQERAWAGCGGCWCTGCSCGNAGAAAAAEKGTATLSLGLERLCRSGAVATLAAAALAAASVAAAAAGNPTPPAMPRPKGMPMPPREPASVATGLWERRPRRGWGTGRASVWGVTPTGSEGCRVDSLERGRSMSPRSPRRGERPRSSASCWCCRADGCGASAQGGW
mmetsp:Transcript_12703/g.40596  ORF Transcript_12703/g.40596 Transcript_12703/m.40596 type:complete len:268 (-) Transcript_12703:963-1766(-)